MCVRPLAWNHRALLLLLQLGSPSSLRFWPQMEYRLRLLQDGSQSPEPWVSALEPFPLPASPPCAQARPSSAVRAAHVRRRPQGRMHAEPTPRDPSQRKHEGTLMQLWPYPAPALHIWRKLVGSTLRTVWLCGTTAWLQQCDIKHGEHAGRDGLCVRPAAGPFCPRLAPAPPCCPRHCAHLPTPS